MVLGNGEDTVKEERKTEDGDLVDANGVYIEAFLLDSSRRIYFLDYLDKKYSFTYADYKVLDAILGLYVYSSKMPLVFSVKSGKLVKADKFMLTTSPVVLASSGKHTYQTYRNSFAKMKRLGFITEKRHRFTHVIERYLSVNLLTYENALCIEESNAKAQWIEGKKKPDIDTSERLYKSIKYIRDVTYREQRNTVPIRKSRKGKEIVEIPVVEKEKEVDHG